MKKIKYLLAFIVILTVSVVSGCNDYDEVPPKRESVSYTFAMPTPTPLTAEERAEITAIINEYNASSNTAVK